MKLLSYGDPPLLVAMGVDAAVVSCPATSEGIKALPGQVMKARDAGLVCECVGSDWDLVEKTIAAPGLMDTVIAMLDEMATLALLDLVVSCGLTKLEELSSDERDTYQTRYVEHLGRMYRHAQELGLHVCLHTSVMPGLYLNDVAAWDRWLERFPMEANSILLCVGCTRSAGLDTLELIDHWLDRIRVVHIRNVVGRFDEGTARDVRVDNGELDLVSVFEKLDAVGFEGAVMPEHFPKFPCDNGTVVSQGFSLGYCRALMQAALSRREG